MVRKNYNQRAKVVVYGDKIYKDYWAMFHDLLDHGQAPEGYDECGEWPLEEWFIKYYLKLETQEKEVVGAYENL